MSKNVTEKDTKAVIMEKLREVQEELALKSGGESYNPEVAKKVLINTKIIEAVESGYLASLTSIQVMKNEYADLKAGIEIKKAEFEELYDLDSNTAKVFEVVELYKQKSNELDTMFGDKQIEINNLIRDLNDDYINKMKEFDTCFRRDKEEKLHNFDREMKTKREAKEDEFNRYSKTVKEKLENERLILSKEKVEFEEKEAYYQGLADEVDTHASDMKELEVKTIKETETRCKQGSNFEKSLLEKEYEGKLAVLTANYNNSVNRSAEIETLNRQLNEKLDASYKEASALAAKALDTTHEKAAMKVVENMATNQRDDNKKR